MTERRMRGTLLFLLAGSAAAVLPAQDLPTKDTEPAKQANPPDPVTDLLREGDGYYHKRDQDGMARKAIDTYCKALALDDQSAAAYWRIAKAHYWLASRARDDDERAEILKEGIEYAKMGVAADAKDVACHFWLGVMYGSYGQAVGVFQSLHMIEPIKKEMQWVLDHDEAFDEGGAHRVLGRLYHKIPGFKGGDKDVAKRHLRRALELGPKNTLTHLFLAELYVDEGDREQARKVLRALLQQPDDPDYLPECREQKAKARALLKELES